MTASNELLIVHLEERVGRGEKLRMEDNLEREGGGEREGEKERKKRERERERGSESGGRQN
jgi:hypothetical protein